MLLRWVPTKDGKIKIILENPNGYSHETIVCDSNVREVRKVCKKLDKMYGGYRLQQHIGQEDLPKFIVKYCKKV